MRTLLILGMVFLLASCAGDVEEPAPDEAALLILKTKAYHRPEGPPQTMAGLALVLSTYDPATARTTAAIDKQEITFATPSGYEKDEILPVLVKPGRYVIARFMQAGFWGNCFNVDTLALDVKAGEALYLGEIDWAFHSRQVSLAIGLSGDFSLPDDSQTSFVAYDAPDPPHLTQASSQADLASVEDYVRRFEPKFTGLVRKANLYPAHITQPTGLTGKRGFTCGAAQGDSWSWQTHQLQRMRMVYQTMIIPLGK